MQSTLVLFPACHCGRWFSIAGKPYWIWGRGIGTGTVYCPSI